MLYDRLNKRFGLATFESPLFIYRGDYSVDFNDPFSFVVEFRPPIKLTENASGMRVVKP